LERQVITLMELNITSETYHDPTIGDLATLKLCGTIDQKSVQVFESTILELYRKGICRLILDLSDTKYLNSTGLGLLINIAHKVNVVGGGIRLVNVAEKFRVLFDMLGLESCLPILASHEEAIHSFGSTSTPAAPAVPTASTAAQRPAVEAVHLTPPEDPISEPEVAPNMIGELIMETGTTIQQEDQQEDRRGRPLMPQMPILEIPEEKEAPVQFSESAPEAAPAAPMAQVSPAQATPATVKRVTSIHDRAILKKTLALKVADKKSLKPPTPIPSPVRLAEPMAHKKDRRVEEAVPERVKEEGFLHGKFAKEEAPAEIKPSRATLRPDVIAKENIKTPQAQKPVIHIIKRKAVVRYYATMNPYKTYPMAVILNPKSAPAASKEEAHEAVENTLKNPVLWVIPRFPGCTAVPDKIAVDVSSSKGTAEFWLTPAPPVARKARYHPGSRSAMRAKYRMPSLRHTRLGIWPGSGYARFVHFFWPLLGFSSTVSMGFCHC
jgi:anti-anti-sigma factor